MVTVQDYSNDVRPAWCPGCGDFAIWNALKRALAGAGLAPHEVIMVTGIGQGSKTPDYMHITSFNGLHGRPLPVAAGFKLANHAMKVLVVHGDGDGYSEGGNHFLHAVRRNISMVDMVQNNHVYALTKGQTSPTTNKGVRTSTFPLGTLDVPINPLTLALSQGATFVARSYSPDINHMVAMITAALNHRGYALIDIQQVCATYNPAMSNDWYREHVYDLAEQGHDPTDMGAAMARAAEFPGGDRIPVGIFYQDETAPSYEEQLSMLQTGPLVRQPLRIRPEEDYFRLLEEFMTDPIPR
jgi:2-oxoglutarate ferredoxin oxidoreductase subunit beta